MSIFAMRYPTALFGAHVLMVLSGAAAVGQSMDTRSQHPLDPLTPEEYRRTVEILRDGGYVTEAGLYYVINLEEPEKELVIDWRPGKPAGRKAFVVGKSNSKTFEAVVDLVNSQTVSWKELEDVEPNLLMSEEWSIAIRSAFSQAPWREALERRGVRDLQQVVCTPHTIGYFGGSETRRLVRLVCYDGSGTNNYWGRPIEGLQAEVDLDTGQIVRVIDSGSVPLSRAPVDFDKNAVRLERQPLNPTRMIQVGRPSFDIDGHVIQWQNWSFHFRLDPRIGPIISTVTYGDSSDARSVMYQGSLSEVFVPYMDPSESWYFRTYLDAGEFGIGKLATTLVEGDDCPLNATFFDATFADDWGDPYTIASSLCLFERSAGGVAWRHFESESGRTETRRQTDLVLRSIVAIGNYDYILDWIFLQNGSIKAAVGATGVEQVKGVWSKNIGEDDSESDARFGRLVAPGIVAVNHDHFFNFRLDLDIDGQSNSFQIDSLVTRSVNAGTPRKSIWTVESNIAEKESDAMLRIRLDYPALWRVINPSRTGAVGYPPSYELRPNSNAVSLMTHDAYPQRRAGFTEFHVWVTPFSPQEKFAAGSYPNQSRGDNGLPSWTSKNRSIVDTDLVVWYTLGFHHVVRAEDWPVLPTTWHEFELRPFDFFEKNPALDISYDEDPVSR